MEKISPDLKHDRQTFIYAGARALEKASFYGIRSILVLYMIRGPIGLAEENAQTIYGAFVGSFIISQVMGALLGDLLIGNKKAMLLGGLLQALGAFTLSIPSTSALYIGLVAIALGTGLFSPNIQSIYGKFFLNKLKLIDSGFTLFYVVVNIGSGIGIGLIMFIGEPNFTLGFIAAGILMLASVAILFFNKKEDIFITEEKHTANLNQRILTIVITIIGLALFWKIREYGGYKLFSIEQQLMNSASVPVLISAFFTILIGCIASVIWSFYYVPQLKKWATGFLLAGAGYGVALIISDQVSPNMFIYILSMLLLSISEILIVPILYSTLTRNTKPKYLAIIIALAGLPAMIMNYMSNLSWRIYMEQFGLHFATVVLGGIGVIVFAYILFKKKDPAIEQDPS
jgi:POT family proton-dependent oligopeptide transporter